MRKKIDIISIFLILMLLFLPISSILMIHHITLSETIVNIDSGFFGHNKYSFAIDDLSISSNEVKRVVDETGANAAIYQDFKDLKTKTIYFKGEYPNVPMINGRFFIESDFKPQNFCAVIGKNLKSDTYNKNGKDFINVNDQEFEVIGIFGMDTDTSFDGVTFINALADPSAFNKFNNKIYTMDCFDKNGNKYSELFVSLMNEYYGVNVKNISATDATFSQTIPRILYSRWFIMLLICDILCIVLLSLEWKNKKKSEISIKRLLGCKTNRIAFEICLEYALYSGISCLISILICNFFYSQYNRFLFAGMLIYIPCAIIFTLFMVTSLLKLDISEAIRE